MRQRRLAGPTPGQQRPPHPRTTASAPPPDSSVRPGEDQTIPPSRIGQSALNGTTRTSNKQQEQMLPAALITSSTPGKPETNGGFSLRLGRPLDGAEVARSAELLRAMGIEQPVRGVIAPSLAPDEVWSLRMYAAAKGWSIGLAIAQVYERPTRSAKAAEDVPRELDPLGSALAALPNEQAEILQADILAALGGPAPPAGVVGPRIHAALQSAWPLLQRAASRSRRRRPIPLPAMYRERAPRLRASCGRASCSVWRCSFHQPMSRPGSRDRGCSSWTTARQRSAPATSLRATTSKRTTGRCSKPPLAPSWDNR